MTDRVGVAYIPVLHEGYRRFIERNAAGSTLFLIGPELTEGVRSIEKEIRALTTEQVKAAIDSWNITADVVILDTAACIELATQKQLLVFPDEDISRQVIERYFTGSEYLFDSAFLRWDKRNTVAEHQVTGDFVVGLGELETSLLRLAVEQSQLSSDWWRQVGAVIARGGDLLLAGHNHHLPHPLTPYVDGDPRGNFFKGIHLELSTAIHAEASVIATAAKRGISLEGCDMFVTTFPCPPCAKLIAESGFNRLFFIGDYAVLDGEKTLRSRGVELIRVNVENPPTA
jgi:dCMP deaminase